MLESAIKIFVLLKTYRLIQMKLTFRNSAIISFAMLSLSVVSCKSEDQTCTAVIRVVRANGGPATSAKVKLTSNWGLSQKGEIADYLSNSENTKLTDGNGTATFTFKNPAILDIEVTHIAYGNASDLIKLEPGETVTKTITVQ
jgi:hypothetical protein